jgi:hypothetical protein
VEKGHNEPRGRAALSTALRFDATTPMAHPALCGRTPLLCGGLRGF